MTGSPLETDEDGASDHHRAGFRVSDRLSTHELNRLFVSTLYPLLIAPRLNILNYTQLSMLSMEASKSRIAFGRPEIYFPTRLYESTGGWILPSRLSTLLRPPESDRGSSDSKVPWLVLADRSCPNWSCAIEKSWFWCLSPCLELPDDSQYVYTPYLRCPERPNHSNGSSVNSCFFRSAKSHFWTWCDGISDPMG